jgi:hypothetical protein
MIRCISDYLRSLDEAVPFSHEAFEFLDLIVFLYQLPQSISWDSFSGGMTHFWLQLRRVK